MMIKRFLEDWENTKAELIFCRIVIILLLISTLGLIAFGSEEKVIIIPPEIDKTFLFLLVKFTDNKKGSPNRKRDEIAERIRKEYGVKKSPSVDSYNLYTIEQPTACRGRPLCLPFASGLST